MFVFQGEEARAIRELWAAMEELENPVMCSYDPDMFHPDQSSKTTDLGDIALARKLCNACPIKSMCLDFGMKYDDFGIYGGLTPSERRKLKRNIRQRAYRAERIAEINYLKSRKAS